MWWPLPPGKAPGADVKVTDLLYRCYDAAVAGQDPEPVLAEIRGRFQAILDGLGVEFPLDGRLRRCAPISRAGPSGTIWPAAAST